MFGLEYVAPKSLAEFEQAYSQALESDSSSVIEVATNREANVKCHRQMLQLVSESLGEVV